MTSGSAAGSDRALPSGSPLLHRLPPRFSQRPRLLPPSPPALPPAAASPFCSHCTAPTGGPSLHRRHPPRPLRGAAPSTVDGGASTAGLRSSSPRRPPDFRGGSPVVVRPRPRSRPGAPPSTRAPRSPRGGSGVAPCADVVTAATQGPSSLPCRRGRAREPLPPQSTTTLPLNASFLLLSPPLIPHSIFHSLTLSHLMPTS